VGKSLAFVAGALAAALALEAYRWHAKKKEPVLHPWQDRTEPPKIMLSTDPPKWPLGWIPNDARNWCHSSGMFDTYADCGER